MPDVKRGKEYIEIEKAVSQLEKGWKGAGLVHQRAKFGSPEYKKASAAQAAIGDLAEELTGKSFGQKPPTTI